MHQSEHARFGGRRQLSGMVVAVIAVAAATALRWILGRLQNHADPFIEFYPAIIVVTLYDGLASGLLAVALSTAAALLFLHVPTRFDIMHLADVTRAMPFGGMELVVAWICSRAY